MVHYFLMSWLMVDPIFVVVYFEFGTHTRSEDLVSKIIAPLESVSQSVVVFNRRGESSYLPAPCFTILVHCCCSSINVRYQPGTSSTTFVHRFNVQVQVGNNEAPMHCKRWSSKFFSVGLVSRTRALVFCHAKT